MFQGKPLRGGSIVMTAKDNPGMMGASAIREDGTFAFADAPLGPVVVTISTDAMKVGNPSNYVEIPAQYSDPAQSGLTYDVKAGENKDVRFDLQ